MPWLWDAIEEERGKDLWGRWHHLQGFRFLQERPRVEEVQLGRQLELVVRIKRFQLGRFRLELIRRFDEDVEQLVILVVVRLTRLA